MVIERRLTYERSLAPAGWCIAVGLVIQVVTLKWSHPTAFLVFIGIGGSLVAAGVIRYLWVIFTGPAEEEPARTPGGRDDDS